MINRVKNILHNKNGISSISALFAVTLLLSTILFTGCIEIKPFPLDDSDLEILTTSSGVEFVRTPDSFFEDLPDWPYEAKYVEIDGLRQAYAEAGPADGEVVLLLHGQPSWSYLYRKMIPVLSDAGYRVIAMDHLGMGRSDKPIDLEYHSYDNHVYRLEQFIELLELENITTFVQDWGSLIGLDVIGNDPDLFARVVVGDGGLFPIPEGFIPCPLPEDPVEQNNSMNKFHSLITKIPAQQPKIYNKQGKPRLIFRIKNIFDRDQNSSYFTYFTNWILYSRNHEDFRASTMLEAITYFPLTEEELDAYNAPFPARICMAAPRTFPGLVNELGGKHQSAIDGLANFTKPFLTIWASNDPGNLGSMEVQQFLINLVPGAANQPHTRLPEASHFLQDDQGEEIARQMVEFMNGSKKVGYELIDLLHKEVWATSHFTEEEYNAFSPPLLWIKNDPRIMMADKAEFLQSPGCDESGEFTYIWKFEKLFLKVVQLVKMNKPVDSEGLIRITELEKYHLLTYYSGRNVSILENPDGERFIEVSRSVNRSSDTFTLPDDWTLTTQVLQEELKLELTGIVSVLRTDNEDSFQGPLPEGIIIK
jgi:pimeloyl-ACP methyl ester carboxylesterase